MSLIEWIIFFSMGIIGCVFLFLIIVVFASGWFEPHRYRDLDKKK